MVIVNTMMYCRWGIEAGFATTVTFVYLSRQLQWEKKLSAEMYPLLVPSKVLTPSFEIIDLKY